MQKATTAPDLSKRMASASDTNLLLTGRDIPRSPGEESCGTAPVEGYVPQMEEIDLALQQKKLGLEDEEAAGVLAAPMEPKELAGFFSCSVNLIKSIIGAGMLSLPFAFSLVGIVPGSVLMCIAAVMSAFGLYLLTKASYEVSNRDGSFATLAAATYPRLAPLFDLAVALKCICVLIGYLKIIGDLLPATIQAFSSSDATAWYESRLLWVTAVTLFISPVVFMRRMDSLKYTSFLGMISVAYLLVLSVVLWMSTMTETGDVFGYGALFTPISLISLRSYPIMVFAFCCHQNIFPIQNEAKNNRPSRMLTIINLCFGGSLLCYLTFATGSYAAFNNSPTGIDPNIINNYPVSGVQYILARFLYIFLLTFTYPLLSHPARESTCRIVEYYVPAWYARRAKIVYVLTCCFLLSFSWLIACINPPLDFVLGLVGSTAAPVICYFLPAIFWLKIDPSVSRANPLRIGCMVLIGFGVVSTALSLTALIVSVVVKK